MSTQIPYYSLSEMLFAIIILYGVNNLYYEYKNRHYWDRVFKYFDSTCKYIDTYCNIYSTNVHVNKSEEIAKLLHQAFQLYKDINVGTSNSGASAASEASDNMMH